MKPFLLPLLAVALIAPLAASAQTNQVELAVASVAATHMTTDSDINGRPAQIVYVGRAGACEAVSIKWTERRIEHFRVCNGEVSTRNTVAPAWSDEPSTRLLLSSAIRSAVLYGETRQTDSNGYLYVARALPAVSSRCSNIEVIISYDGDLVDRALRNVCGKAGF